MNFYDDFVIKCSPTGSNYICNPPVTNTDIDTVFLVSDVFLSDQTLVSSGWERCIGEGYEIFGGDFQAYRKGNKNYIITGSPEYYKKYVLATRICKMMNLLEKKDRIFMFELVMNGKGLPSNAAIDAFWAQAAANPPVWNAEVGAIT